MFDYIYRKTCELAESRYAPAYLYGLTFCESSFFPIPTDVMLGPMCAVSPQRALRYAWWTTIYSLLGALFGYFIGYYAFHLITDIFSAAWWDHYQDAKRFFDEWGGFALFIAAVSPFPFKVATITAGSLEQNLLIFVLASLAGRALRFYAVALLCAYFGPPILETLKKKINFWGWSISVVIILAILIYVLLR